jgi:hypothetical protein
MRNVTRWSGKTSGETIPGPRSRIGADGARSGACAIALGAAIQVKHQRKNIATNRNTDEYLIRILLLLPSMPV